MNAKELGEQTVFPLKIKTVDNTKIFNYGMNLRELFAYGAMRSLIATYAADVVEDSVHIAKEAVIYADALLNELCKK